jgi:outer membrane lipoprotein SlyB
MLNFKTRCSLLIFLFISACASNTTPIVGNIQKVDVGTIIELKEIPIRDDSDSLGTSVGVSVGSGGHAGIYGVLDLGKVFSTLNKPTKQLELMIKKQNGELVVITQPLGGNFKAGDKVKILLRNGRAVVQY